MGQYITKPSYNLTLPNEPVVFFGTGIVSLKSLEHIAKSYDIEAVITLTDRLSSNSQKIPSLVKQWAIKHRVKVVEVNNKNELANIFEKSSFVSQLGIVIDFGIILPIPVIEYFNKGIINSHFSLLPKWRGSDPITFAILSGQQQTGISIMQVNEGLDTGDILDQITLKIDQSDTSSTLTDKLIALSNATMDKILPNILAGNQHKKKQVGTPTYTRKLSKTDGLLDWSKPAGQLEREIRGYNGWPTSYTTIDTEKIIVTKATAITYKPKKTGLFVLTNDNQLAVSCKDSLLVINTLKPAGKKEMNSVSFLAGRQKFRNQLLILQQ